MADNRIMVELLQASTKGRNKTSREDTRTSDDRINKLADQISTLADIFAKKVITPAPVKENQSSTSGTLSSNTIPNPKGEMKTITTRSGSTAHIQLPVTPILEPDVLKILPKPNIPYPSRLNDQKLCEKARNKMEKFFQIFQDFHFDISFEDALLLMPKFASTIKSLFTNKDKLFELAKIPLNENCSAMLLKKLPKKLGDPGKFLISCDFPRMDKKIEAYLKDESISPKISHADCDPKGDIFLIEKLLNNDPFQLPLMDLKQGEVVKAKSSIKEPLELELKELPSHLEYAYLEGVDKLLVIIAKDLKVNENEALLKVLKSHKRAIALKITNIKGRQAESQAEIYKIDLDHANKVLSMKEDETEPAEVQEVVDVVTTAKLITEVVTAASETITAASTNITAAEAQVLAVTLTVAPARVTAAPSRRRKGGVIRDHEEESTTSTIIPAETKSKDKAINHVKRKAKEDPAMKRYQVLKRKPQTEAQARNNMMVYLKNVAGFKMDYFKTLWSLVKERFSTTKPKNFSNDFLLVTLGEMFEKPDILYTVQNTPSRGLG
uniref:Reverse transcriptase domain-containing protein n=1 Tax=Tanacetum cinerariifolium TaxID=118510 RepID=A0A6L2P6H8_TANCI|nr:hypothetical protein [Tanacetum cinerariifolium]